MATDTLLLIGTFILGAIALIGFFITKTKGFGRYATSALLILLATISSVLMFVGGKLEGQIFANIIFAIIGFAGGLFTGKEST